MAQVHTNGVNGMNGVNGVNGVNGGNGVNDVDGPRGRLAGKNAIITGAAG